MSTVVKVGDTCYVGGRRAVYGPWRDFAPRVAQHPQGSVLETLIMNSALGGTSVMARSEGFIRNLVRDIANAYTDAISKALPASVILGDCGWEFLATEDYAEQWADPQSRAEQRRLIVDAVMGVSLTDIMKSFGVNVHPALMESFGVDVHPTPR